LKDYLSVRPNDVQKLKIILLIIKVSCRKKNDTFLFLSVNPEKETRTIIFMLHSKNMKYIYKNFGSKNGSFVRAIVGSCAIGWVDFELLKSGIHTVF
jgi:hypothetical protein